jgi:hypothetical protein
MGLAQLQKRIEVASEDFPDGSILCQLCGGPLVVKPMDFPITRDYDEVWAEVLLVNLPVARCEDCTAIWIVDDVISSLEDDVEKAFLELRGRAALVV